MVVFLHGIRIAGAQFAGVFTGFPIAGGHFACVFYRYAYSWEALCTYFYLVFLQLGSILHVFLHVFL